MSNFVGFQSAASATISVPSHANGDLLWGVWYSASTTIPSTPSGWTAVYGQSAASSIRVAYRVSDGTISSVTATNGVAGAVWVFTSPDATPNGGFSNTGIGAPVSTLTVGSLTLADSDGSSWRVTSGAIQATSVTVTPTGGLTQRGSTVEAGGWSFLFFDEAEITTAPGDTMAIAPSSTYVTRSRSDEIRLVPVSGGGNKFRPYFITG